MKKATKKNASKPSGRKAVKDLDVKPSRGGAVRGGRAGDKLAGGGGGGGGTGGGGGGGGLSKI